MIQPTLHAIRTATLPSSTCGGFGYCNYYTTPTAIPVATGVNINLNGNDSELKLANGIIGMWHQFSPDSFLSLLVGFIVMLALIRQMIKTIRNRVERNC
jgi:hypothetical protein